MFGSIYFDDWYRFLKMQKESECTSPKDYGIYLASKRKKKKKNYKHR